MVLNVYRVRMFLNGMVTFAMAERAWMTIGGRGALKPVKHRNTLQKYARFGNDQHSTIRMLAGQFHIDKETIRKIIMENY